MCHQTEPPLHHFNPRSRKGSDRYLKWFTSLLIISIHAPARGATKFAYYKAEVEDISIHAPARGATITIDVMGVRQVYFNPRSRKGSDKLWTTAHLQEQISIHAPARGATIFISTGGFPLKDFNPRSRKGSDYPHILPSSS